MAVRRPTGAPWSVVDVERLIVQGRYGNAAAALAEIDVNLAQFRTTAQGEEWLIALYARALMLARSSPSRAEVVAAWTQLELQARQLRSRAWVTIARANRAHTRLEHGEPAAALGDLARIGDLPDESDAAREDLDSVTGLRMLDAVATAFSSARIADRAEQARQLIERHISNREPMDRAAHWAAWAGELTARAMDPVARGARDPEPHQFARALELAQRVAAMEVHEVPAPVSRSANAVLALTETYRGHSREALRLLGSDGFGEPTGLDTPASQLAVIAALRAHTVLESYDTARSLDNNALRKAGALPTMILEVCRARERLLLERDAKGDIDHAHSRLSDTLVRLSWQSLELLSQTSRQALEHQQLLTESRTDPLTGVGNRRAFDEVLHSMLRFGRLPLGMVIVDLDRFKRVNDEFTHVVGDEVLRHVARTLREQIGPNDKLIRYGGDEFIVLLEGAGDAEATTVANTLRDAVHAVDWTRFAAGLSLRVTTGHAALYALSGRRPTADGERLFRRADESLLEAKRLRRELVADQPVKDEISLTAAPQTQNHDAPRPQEPTDSPSAAGSTHAAAHDPQIASSPQPASSPQLSGATLAAATAPDSGPAAVSEPYEPPTPTPPTLIPPSVSSTGPRISRRARRASLIDLQPGEVNGWPRHIS